MTEMKLQELHDQIVASRPESESCPEACPFCSGEYAASYVEGGNDVSDKTYSEEEIQALVSAAVAKATTDLTTELETFKAGDAEAARQAELEALKVDMQAQVDAAKAEAETQIADLTSKLDAAVVEAQTAKTERDEITSWLDAENARVLAEAEQATLRAERISKVAEVVTFPEDYVNERAEKWASLDEEQFEALLADYTTLGANAKSTTPGSPPRDTAMVASRETSDTSNVGSALRDLIEGRNYGVDPRAIR